MIYSGGCIEGSLRRGSLRSAWDCRSRRRYSVFVMDLATLRFANAAWMVTKDGGEAGGFPAKASAARKAGAGLVVIGRPPQRGGLPFAAVLDVLCERFGCTVRPQVRIVGIGPGSREAMTREVSETIEAADCLIGAKRMLEAVARQGQPTYDAIAPQDIADFIRTHWEYRRFAVVMSGDTGFFSGTKKLLPLLEGCDTAVLPGLSSLSYLCARLRTSYEDVRVVSLHGRQHNILPEVRATSRLFALVGGERGINDLCRTLTEGDLGHVSVYVGQRLGYPGFSVPRRLQGYHLRLRKGERRQAVRQLSHGLQRNGRGHDADMGIFCQQQRHDLPHIAGTAAGECPWFP